MKSFSEKIRSLIYPKKGNPLVPDGSPFDFVRTRKSILRELIISKQSKNIIGVYCKAFGEGMFLTAVEDIELTAKAEIIVFHRYDMSGRALSRNKIQLEEIQMVFPFNKVYQKPRLRSDGEKIKDYSIVTAASA